MVVNSPTSAVKVTRYKSLVKIVIVQNLCKLSIFSNTNFSVCFHNVKGLRYKLSRTVNIGYLVKLQSNHEETLSPKNLENIGNFEG